MVVHTPDPVACDSRILKALLLGRVVGNLRALGWPLSLSKSFLGLVGTHSVLHLHLLWLSRFLPCSSVSAQRWILWSTAPCLSSIRGKAACCVTAMCGRHSVRINDE